MFLRLLKNTQGEGMDRAVIYASLNPLWQLISGPISLIFIISFLSPDIQGYFYTFHSLIALKSFFELGLFVVIVNTASHEWASLELDNKGFIVGSDESKSRLVSLGRFIFKWYAVASGLFVLIIGLAGYFFLGSRPDAGMLWQKPWVILVIVYGFILWALPFNSLLEGCNQVVNINKFRLSQSVLSTIALWVSLSAGLELWSIAVYAFVLILRDFLLLFVKYRNFFKIFYSKPEGPVISWKNEILPMQWRLATAGVVNYFAFWLFTPIMFYFHGPTIAGQMGMTWQIIMIMQSVGMAWITTKIPAFGIHIAKKEYTCLDKLWFKASLSSIAVVLFCAVIFLLFIAGINWQQISWSGRLLGPYPVMFFLIGLILMQISQCESAYFRAHKQEPILFMNVSTSILMGILVFIFGDIWGAIGASLVYMLIMMLIVVWETLIWFRFRTLQHNLQDRI